MPVTSQEQLFRQAADVFHRIATALEAERMLSREGYKMPSQLFEKLEAAKLSRAEMSAAAADGFELCVRALAEMGAADVTIHECGERDMEEHW